MTNVEYDGDSLRIGEETIDLPNPVDDVVLYDDLVLVLLRTNSPDPAADNVWAFTKNGQLHWKAQPVEAPYDDDNTYTSIENRGGEIWASDWLGAEHRLAPQTGDRIDSEFRK